uniref:Uncharacterized protein n=1 Tax=Anguilla anguilla TaxID=7936 RepID=A0A0E9PNJ3_ANGAN
MSDSTLKGRVKDLHLNPLAVLFSFDRMSSFSVLSFSFAFISWERDSWMEFMI